ncbi:transcriptional regulator, DeoR family [Roseomonas rosea]|uniref:Transcriptional regulator, DeoR family n=1 Tax=Muricoccus roseus TaxID=198092 RepID=A0A1M6S3T3_9PROT|nr:DeoR/GlpR family DNA-binding transcription regulator [Roseomonas rosea]SHK39336.1 transcriptional regulator, DeoR family [Roseomonas rosea]
MWSQERHNLILEKLRAQRRIAVDGMAEELGVSRETVRRDLVDLEAAGFLRRVHGGAVLTEIAPEEPFARRLQLRRAEKTAIARATLPLLKAGETCFVDAGSTTALLAVELCRLSGLTVITNSLEVAQAFRAQGAAHHTILLGGRVQPDMPGTSGEALMAELSRYSADVALVSPMGLHPEEGATSFIAAEAEIARQMVGRSRRTILLADHSKLGVVSRAQVCPCARIAALVTDAAGRPHAAAFRGAGIGEVVVAET